MRTQEEVLYAFRPVGKLTEAQSMRVMKIQKAFEDLATEIIDLAPDCPDRTSALRKLLESKFTCVQAISHYYEVAPKGTSSNEKTNKKGASARA